MSSVQHLSRGQQTRIPTRRLSVGECRDWLRNHREGRLGYHTGRGPRSVVVSYAVAEDQIMMQLPDYNDIVHYAPGERVTLEVEGGRPVVGDFGTVTVTGQAQLAADDSRPASQTHFDEQWPSGVSTSVICLPLTEVEGYELPLG
jgi:nitroimidazol reductase NimA-like FMN-containing flavoprotein (pyridoxamine 5'-phosphate oxidase superfamily)